ncbi:hypothetical protein OE88DRAFT_1734804 [Heliocybe sulcata]|uniref:HNH nuclease domain-containing protein n=1 Tax=Heliocybe sulcata TaxID=5364 RepID=A0A5C3N3H3_9AGAM|nr:hypothetical protein OE88DRAFT_1734804 [Heliocybe sulcata]
MSSLVSEPVADTHVRLIIVLNVLWLDIPYTILRPLCLYPLKYFRYLGWAILGRAILGLQGKVYYGAEVACDDAPVVCGETYEFRTENMAGAAPVNVDVSKKKSESITQMSRRENLKRMVGPRDGRCIFTGHSHLGCEAMHIIPFTRGQDWFERIVRSRRDTSQSDLEDTPLNDLKLDSTSNGFLVVGGLHRWIDRWVAALPVPNPVLTRDDIDISINPHRESDGRVEYLTDRSYILQWLKLPDDEYDREGVLRIAPNNSLAAFVKGTPIPKPSPLLLNYMYGCTAIRCWGREHGSMSDLPGFVPTPEVIVRRTSTSDSRDIGRER